jgi:antitoxin ParD1/3/4
MAQLNISLPDPIYDWVNSQVKEGYFASSSDYLQQLITQAQKHQALQKAITEGLESGISQRLVADIIKEAKAELKAG